MRYQKTDVELLAAFLPRSGVMGLEGHLSDDNVGAAESSLGRPELSWASRWRNPMHFLFPQALWFLTGLPTASSEEPRDQCPPQERGPVTSGDRNALSL